MRKLSFIILFITCFANSFSQQIWRSQDYEKAYKTFDDVERAFKWSGNKTWSEKLLAAFPIASDRSIKHQYVVYSDSTFNIEDLCHLLSAWCKTKFPEAAPESDIAHKQLMISGLLKGVGKSNGAYGAYISAKEEVIIDIKENRVRVTSRIFNYVIGTWKGGDFEIPGDCYPANPNASRKESHAMAFINCHYNALLTVSSLIKYLNDNMSIIKKENDDW